MNSTLHPAKDSGRNVARNQQPPRMDSATDFVAHPSFEDPKTEKELFGPNAQRISVNTWTHFPEVPEDVTNKRAARTALTASQESRLFLQYNYARYQLAQLAQEQHRKVSPERSEEMQMWHDRAMRLRSDLVGANMALVLAMAKRTRIPNVEFTELISEGNMALLRAIEKFDVSRGFKFSTYACRAILKSFNRLATKTGRYRERFPTEYDPEMEKSDEDIRRHEEQRENALDDLREILDRNQASLSDIERIVVIERFGLNGSEKGKTLAQVGKIVGLTNERVRQIQIGALAKIRQTLNDDFLAA